MLAALALAMPAQAQRRDKRPKQLKPAYLVVVTNFAQAQVTVNGLPYDAFPEPGEPEGMALPAGGPYEVVVIADGNRQTFTLGLRPYETRYLVVQPSATSTASPARATAVAVTPTPQEASSDDSGEGGKVTVYAKPRGDIFVDGKDMGQSAPNTVNIAAGRHEVQVRYEGGEMSEKKIVRVRKGSSIKLFFRQRATQ